jgi:hypothetical protein
MLRVGCLGMVSSSPGASRGEIGLQRSQGFEGTFGAKRGYAMVLHTDQPHPHVHMVVKAESEEGAAVAYR